jgi:putative ABC transport system permease protein
MLLNYLKIAIRHVLKNKVFSFVNISGLAVGMACCILILLWVKDELSYDRFHTNTHRLYRVVSCMDDTWTSASPWSLAPALKNDFPEIVKATRFNNRTMLVKYGDMNFNENVGLVDPDFLEMFSFQLLKGVSKEPLVNVNSVIISKTAANKYFRNEEPVGKILTVDNTINLTVTGVIEDVPLNSSLQFDMLASVRLMGEERIQTWYLETSAYVLIQEHVLLDNLRSKIAGTTMKYDKRIENQTVTNDLQPISHIHLYALNDIGGILYVYLFSIVAAVVLIIACINFINLTTAISGQRAKEVGMRKVAGAGRMNLIRQFFGESLLMSFLAFFLSLILVVLLLPYFNILSEKHLSLDPRHDLSLILSLAIITVIAGLVSGCYPALLLSSLKPLNILNKSVSLGSKKLNLKRALIIFQFTVAIVLIICSTTMQRQMNYTQKKDLGFNRNHVIRITMIQEIRNQYDTFKNELLQNPNVVNVTSATSIPTSIGNINPVYWAGRGPDQYETMNFVAADYDYFETFEMRIIEGRSFSRMFPTDEQSYIVNQAAVRFMKLNSPLGKLFSIWTREGRIIGVVEDFHSRSLHDEIVPVVFTLTKNWSHNHIFIRINPVDKQNSIKYVESVWKRFAVDYPFTYEFLDDIFQHQYLSDVRIATLSRYFTFLAVYISCLGLFGLASFMAEQRTKEIGIRKVLGASILHIIAIISKEFLYLIAIANIIAWPIAYYAMHRWLQNFAYKTNISYLTFFMSAAVVIAIALFTISYQSIKAAIANPIMSLRYE